MSNFEPPAETLKPFSTSLIQQKSKKEKYRKYMITGLKFTSDNF